MIPENPFTKKQRRIYSRLFTGLLNKTGFVSPPTKHVQDYADGIVDLLRAKVGENSIPPVFLSSAAEDFLIDPEPIFNRDKYSNTGQISFDQKNGHFVIEMENELLTNPNDMPVNFAESGLTPRGRFTYAHEIAHRFFFVPTNHGWEWGITLLTKYKKHSSFLQFAFYYLNRQEERYCNQIARQVLVPADALPTTTQLDSSLGEFISDVSKKFLVPIPSALLAVRDAIQEGYFTKEPNIFIMYLCAQKRAGGISSIRIDCSIGPFADNNLGLRTPYLWKASSEYLGYGFNEFILSLFRSSGFKDYREEVDTSLLLKNKINNSDVFNLRGWWYPLANNEFFKSGLVYGRLSKH